ncbi:MAG: divergent PAP2 family protein [Elusimicrobia bacterium]|nr:divergent PAP2 family protein [Elusimicrobiota bacterium]
MQENAIIILLVSFCVWFITQTLKFIMVAIFERKIIFRTYFVEGGMPSTHSAIAVSFAVGMGMMYGFTSPFFAMGAIFSVAIIYDAVKVRGSISQNTKTIRNYIVDIIENEYIKKNEKLLMLEKDIKQISEDNYETSLKQIKKMKKQMEDLKKLEVVLGHTIFEAFVGSVIGGVVAFLYFYFTLK